MENYSTNSGAKKIAGPVLLSIVFLLLLGIALYLSSWGSKGAVESVQTLETGDVLTKARGARLVSSFPEELILDEKAKVTESFSISYVNEDLNMPVASFESSLSYAEAINKYGEYINNNGWQIVHEADPANDVTFWYGKKEGEDLNVTFELREGKTFISVAYSKVN